MTSLRSQLHRRTALRRAWPSSEVEAEGARSYWLSLDVETRTAYLSFEDAGVVQRMHDHMSGLCKSEIWCQRNMLGGLVSRSSGESVERLKGFAFERPTERDCIGRLAAPTAFCALREVAGNDDIFEELTRRLGGRLLEGRPVFNQKDWVAAVEATPSSWAELQLIAYRLVELAIFQAHKDAKDYAASQEAARRVAAADEALAAELCELCAGSSPSTSSTAGRRRAKKGRGSAAAQQSGPGAVAAAVSEPIVTASSTGEAAEEVATIEACPLPSTAPALARATRPGARPESSSSRWAAWLQSLVREDGSELRWRLSDPSGAATLSLRAAVKNTFLEVTPEGEEESYESTWFRRSCYF